MPRVGKTMDRKRIRRRMQELPRWLLLGAEVHYHPIIGEPHDGRVYVVRHVGEYSGMHVAWLEGKSGFVWSEALSPVKQGTGQSPAAEGER